MICYVSHRTTEPRNELPWSTIQSKISTAKCNVLAILNCCFSGLAKVSTANEYAKELITTTGCNETIFCGVMAPLIANALHRWYWASTKLTGRDLHRVISRSLQARRQTARLGSRRTELAVLKARKKKLDDELHKLEGTMRNMTINRKIKAQVHCKEKEAWDLAKIIKCEEKEIGRIEEDQAWKPCYMTGNSSSKDGAVKFWALQRK